MRFEINNLLNGIDRNRTNLFLPDKKTDNIAEVNNVRQDTPDFEIYKNTTVSVPLAKDDSQYDFARRGYVEHAAKPV